MPRRPGQDAAPRGPRRASSPTCATTTTPAQLAELDIAPFELVVVNLYPFAADGRLGRRARRVRRADRHRRADDGPRRGQEPPAASPSSSRPGRYAEVARRPRRPAASRWTQRKRLAGEAFAHTAAYDVAVASWFAGSLAPADERAASRRSLGATWQRARTCCATARTRTRRRRSTSARPAPARPRARPSSCTARRCPTTTTSTPTPPARGARLRPRRRRDHQARQPVRHRRRRRRRRGPPQGARLRPGVGVRRGHRRQPPGHGRAGPADRRDLHRGRRRPGVRRRRGRGAPAQDDHPGAAHRRPRRPRARAAAGHRRRAAAARRRPRRAGRRPGHLDEPDRRRGRPARRCATSPSPGGPAGS